MAHPAILIKKYANRRLYDTSTSQYITLKTLAGMVQEGLEFTVRDAKSGNDMTRAVLIQILVEEETRGPILLSEKALRQLISLHKKDHLERITSLLEEALDQFAR